MARPIAVVGAGGFGREVLDVIEAINSIDGDAGWTIAGVVDDSPSPKNLERLAARGIPFLGDLNALPAGISVSIAVGSPLQRQLIYRSLSVNHFQFPTLIHPGSMVGSRLTIGEGSIVCGGVCLGTNVTLGHQVHLNPRSVVGHDANLRDFVSVNPNATISGDCEIGEAALVGAGAVVLQGLRVGEASVIGAAACVTRDCESHVIVKGVPGRATRCTG